MKKFLLSILVAASFFNTVAQSQVPPVAGPAGQPGVATGAPPPAPAGRPLRIERDIEFARVGNRALHLDLYLRDTVDKKPLPVVVWVHGGGWVGGDKFPNPAARLVANGYAVASVEYRLAGEATFPAQLHDVKAAVRWLRANAQKYNLDGAHIGAWGNSAGGHLVALLGTTGDVKELEGNLGNLDQSSRVQAVVDFYGPIDLMRMDATATKPKSDDPKLAEAILLGGVMSKNADKAKAANPITYITKDDAPFLIVHGTADTLVPPVQSEFLQIALKHAGVENNLEYVYGAPHSMAQVQTPAVAELVTNFFDKHLRDNQHQRDDISTITEPSDSWADPFADELPGTQYKLFATPTRGPDTQASYRLYLPPGYNLAENAQRRYPVIYYLHGVNDDSRKAIHAGYIYRLDVAIRTGIMPAAIVVVVQALNRGGYVDSADGKSPIVSVMIKDLIPHVDKTYRTVATRDGRAIEGHSMGGAGTLRIGFSYPELFGSVAAFAPALGQQTVSPVAQTGANGPTTVDGVWAVVEKNADQIRGRTHIRLICGDLDNLLARSKLMSSVLTGLKIEHTLTESKGAPHSVKEVIARLDTNPFEFYGKAFAAFK